MATEERLDPQNFQFGQQLLLDLIIIDDRMKMRIVGDRRTIAIAATATRASGAVDFRTASGITAAIFDETQASHNVLLFAMRR